MVINLLLLTEYSTSVNSIMVDSLFVVVFGNCSKSSCSSKSIVFTNGIYFKKIISVIFSKQILLHAYSVCIYIFSIQNSKFKHMTKHL